MLGFSGQDLGYGNHVVLPGLRLTIHEGEKLALLGPSGAGKSTLLTALYRQVADRAALCPQDLGLVDVLSVYHNIYMGQLDRHGALYNLCNLIRPMGSHRLAVAELAHEFGLGALLERSVDSLSGGQRQRVALARALYRRQPLFLGDEPVTGLDPAQSRQLLALVLARHQSAVLALGYRHRWVRLLCAAVRAVHELFWGLLFLQVFGLSALTGLLAIALPYSGVFARVYAEILERQSPLPGATLPPASDRVSRHAYTLLPQAWAELLHYTRYRFECALRASAILGFIGLPTLGFHLETAFKQGQYRESAALLLLFFALIASIRYWLRAKALPLLLLLAYWVLPESPAVERSYLWHFLGHDIWPAPLREGDVAGALQWYGRQLSEVALPAVVDTLLLAQLALVLSGLLALLGYGWASRQLVAGPLYLLGHLLLLVLRSTPEMVFASVLLLLCGPSALPAVLALALHNGGLIAYLLAGWSDRLRLRPDAATGLNRYWYELTPRLYAGFIALLLYRWEVILRESAILGILGLTTLGFYIDSAFEDIRYDRAVLLIGVAAALNMLVDSIARRLRRYGRTQAVTVR